MKMRIGSRYTAPPVPCFERRGIGGSFESFMEFPGSQGELLQRALLSRRAPRSWKRSYLLLLLVVLALVLGACGGSSSDDEDKTIGPVDCKATPERCI